MPVGEKASERRLLRRLDFLAQRRERRAAEPPQHIGIAPFPLSPARAQLAAHELFLALEPLQQRLDVAAEALVCLRRRERPAPARIPQQELLERLRPSLEEDLREAARGHHAEGVSVTAGVLRRNQPLLAREAHEQRAPLAQQRLREAFVVFAGAQIATQAQLVV